MGFFCSDNFGRSIYSTWRNLSRIIKSWSSIDLETKKIVLKFASFEELSRIEVLCEHMIFDMILFTFSVIFPQIKIFFL